MTNQPKRMGYTSTDFTNALLYAQMRLLYEKTQKNPNVQWKNINDDGTIPYFCPPELKDCYYGFPKITSPDECKKQSTYDLSKIKDISSQPPGNKNGWYLRWNANDSNCYKSNHLFTYECNHNFDNPLKADGLLQYDSDTQQCNITKKYCDKYGYKNYNEGTAPNYLDRSCEMNTGQTVSEALFGDTISRGVLGGACL